MAHIQKIPCELIAPISGCSRVGAKRRGALPLPASPETVAAFVAHDAIKSSPSTLRRRLAGIRKVHRLLRLPNPVEDEDVLIAMRRALRTKPRRQKQAHGLTRELRDKLLAACPDTLLGLRNRALVAVGYDTLCRRAELVSLRIEDLTQLEDGAMSIFVRRAKNDPFGDGRYGYITARTVQILGLGSKPPRSKRDGSSAKSPATASARTPCIPIQSI